MERLFLTAAGAARFVLTCGLLTGILQAANLRLTVPHFRQEEKGCGAASVAMVMHYWGAQSPHNPGYPTAEEAYQQLYRREVKGIRLAEMKSYMETHGFDAFTLRGRFADLEEQIAKGRPPIAVLKRGNRAPLHYVVVTGIAGTHVSMNDPTKSGVTRLKQDDFLKQWGAADHWMLLAVPRA